MKFPPIQAEMEYKKHGMKEFYVFRDPKDPTCPILIHFVLANKTFKDEIRPGKTRFSLFYFTKVICKLARTIAMSYYIDNVGLQSERSGFEPWPGHCVVTAWARHFTLTLPLSTQEYKWVLTYCYKYLKMLKMSGFNCAI